MNLREKIKSYSFWVSLASAVILILKVLGSRFGFQVDETMISDLFTALCSILVILGIIVVPQQKQDQIFTTEVVEKNSQHSTKETKTDEPVNTPEPVAQVEEEPVKESPQEPVTIQEEQPPVIQPSEPEIQTPIIPYEEPENPFVQTSVNLKTYLENERNNFSGNIDEFISLLREEINSIKPKEEA